MSDVNKATCMKCGKSVSWTKINIAVIDYRHYTLCDDCQTAVLDFIKGKEMDEPYINQEDIVNYIHAMSNLDKTVIEIILNLEMDYLKLKGIAED